VGSIQGLMALEKRGRNPSSNLVSKKICQIKQLRKAVGVSLARIITSITSFNCAY
jgi:hypothetical protein